MFFHAFEFVSPYRSSEGDHMKDVCEGEVVCIAGLQARADLNGQRGVVEGFIYSHLT